MIIEVEDRFCKVAKQFSRVLASIKRAAKRGDAVHEIEETTWGGLIEVGREMIAAHIKQQDEQLPRPKVIEHEGKTLRRLPRRRTRKYVSAEVRQRDPRKRRTVVAIMDGETKLRDLQELLILA